MTYNILSMTENNAEAFMIQCYHFWHDNYVEKRYDINDPDWSFLQNSFEFQCQDYVYHSLSAFLRTLYLCSSCPLKSLKHQNQEPCCQERFILGLIGSIQFHDDETTKYCLTHLAKMEELPIVEIAAFELAFALKCAGYMIMPISLYQLRESIKAANPLPKTH